MSSIYDRYNVPGGANIDNNIAEARNYAETHSVAQSYLWFLNKVKNNLDGHLPASESWDYKQLSPGYADFGNLNYGATGAAMGIPEAVLYRMAGLVQMWAGTSKDEYGNPLGGFPYGDDPRDQEKIKQGIEYTKDQGMDRPAITQPLSIIMDPFLPWLSPFLSGKIGDAISDLFGKARATGSPLVFDLDGDGIEISPLGNSSPTLFDHDANGIKTGTAWLNSDDALLVLDRNGNGTIDSGRELFGNNTLLSNGNKAADGYAALGELDSNGDGVIDAQDAQFSALRLWRDLDQDGVSDAGELSGLDALGVTQISLAKTNSSKTLSDGTRLDGSASFVVNGEERSYTDAWFAENPFYREFTDSIPLTEAAKQLPGMKGAGAVRDLREAASLDASLAAQLAGMQSGWVSRADMQGQVETLVSQWARTADFETSREKALAMGVQLLFKPQGVTDAEVVNWNRVPRKTSFPENRDSQNQQVTVLTLWKMEVFRGAQSCNHAGSKPQFSLI